MGLAMRMCSIGERSRSCTGRAGGVGSESGIGIGPEMEEGMGMSFVRRQDGGGERCGRRGECWTVGAAMHVFMDVGMYDRL